MKTNIFPPQRGKHSSRAIIPHLLLLLLCVCSSASGLSQAAGQLQICTPSYEPVVQQGCHIRFGKYFYDRTLRVDYHRRGNAAADTLMPAGQPTAFADLWAGRRGKQAIDPVEGGRYRMVVSDHATHKVLYTFSCNTLFSEYRELPVARAGLSASFEETVLLPAPKRPVDLFFQQRDSQQTFRTQTALTLTPAVQPATTPAPKMRALHRSGDPRHCMDIVIVPEGYGPQDSLKMERDLERFAGYAIGKGPFKELANHINLWGVEILGSESGITDPTRRILAHSAVGSSYGTFGSDRYLMTQQVFRLYDVLRGMPFDHIIIMANSETYGGGGIYNYYTMSAVQNMSEWILPHELGHSIGGLADEYVDSDTNFSAMHPRGIEPVEPNITTLVNFASKWQADIPAGTPVPTPAPAQRLPQDQCGPLGAYEGAGYVPHGVFRPTPHCMMRDYHPFCPVCTRHLNKVIHSFLR